MVPGIGENGAMENAPSQGFAAPPTDEEIAFNAAMQARALGMARTLNDQLRGLGFPTHAEKLAAQESVFTSAKPASGF